MRLGLILSLLLSCSAPALAQNIAPEDKRIQSYVYHPGVVYEVISYNGYVTTIAFNKKIIAITLGDSKAWDVSPFGDKSMLYIKPIDNSNSETNMAVVVDGNKIINFRLKGRNSYAPENEIIHKIDFSYSDDKKPEEKEKSNQFSIDGLNFNYSYKRDDELRPVRIFDDGKKTYFQWPSNRRQPSIFIVDKYGNEGIINYTVSGDFTIVHAISERFTLRDGEYSTCIYNLSPAPPDPGFDGGSPQKIEEPFFLLRGVASNDG